MNPPSSRKPTAVITRRLPVAAIFAVIIAFYLTFGQHLAAALPTSPALPARPNFVVIQTDDSTLEQLYASYTPSAGAETIRAMPNTLELIAKKGATFNRYYVSYSLCAPSRASLLTGRYAHNDEDRGNVEPDGATPASARAPAGTTTSPPGFRARATGRSTSASSSTAMAKLPTRPLPKCRRAGAPGTR